MSLEIRTPNGKLFGLTDTEDEFVIVNNKKIALHDVYQDKTLMDELNDDIKNSDRVIQDVAE